MSERFVCPYCNRASSHPEDIANRYCSCCGCPPLLPKDCLHVRAREAASRAAGDRLWRILLRPRPEP